MKIFDHIKNHKISYGLGALVVIAVAVVMYAPGNFVGDLTGNLRSFSMTPTSVRGTFTTTKTPPLGDPVDASDMEMVTYKAELKSFGAEVSPLTNGDQALLSFSLTSTDPVQLTGVTFNVDSKLDNSYDSVTNYMLYRGSTRIMSSSTPSFTLSTPLDVNATFYLKATVRGANTVGETVTTTLSPSNIKLKGYKLIGGVRMPVPVVVNGGFVEHELSY